MDLQDAAVNWPKNSSSAAVSRGRTSSLHTASMKEQRKLEENLESLSREMRARMNELDSETSEMRRHATRMFDAVRRREHQRLIKSRSDATCSPFSGSSGNLSEISNLSTSRDKLVSYQNDTCAPLPHIPLGRCHSSPVSIAKLGRLHVTDSVAAPEASSRGDVSDESIAADAASIPVTKMPNFCSGRELEMIGESAFAESEDQLDDDDDVFKTDFRVRAMSEGAPSPVFNGAGVSHPPRRQTLSGKKSDVLLSRRRRSDIAKPVSLPGSPRLSRARRHSTHDPPFIPTPSSGQNPTHLTVHRTASVNLPPLRLPTNDVRSSSVGQHGPSPPLSPTASVRSGPRGSLSQGASPTASPSASLRNLAAARSTALHRRASRTESVPCIMKQTFASTPRRSVSQVVGELVHIEEMRRYSRDSSVSMHADCRKVKKAWQANRSVSGSTLQQDAVDDTLTKTKSLGDLFNELKDCRYLRIANQDATQS